MRLINTDTLELHEFPGIVPEYAILSHTWGDEEVTLQDWEAAQRLGTILPLYSEIQQVVSPAVSQGSVPDGPPTAPPTRRNTDGSVQDWLGSLNLHGTRFGCWKILKSCSQARGDGLSWLWADTTCIDKTSSAELSEAINSMYVWYRNATVCYAYIEDVPGSSAYADNFRASRWFSRGWTLQELLAPEHVEFFSRDWVKIGTKKSLSKLLFEITGISEKYLLRMEGILGASIAQRMSWVSNRTTTRPEDIAYCMLGIFDVSMPLIYGEGAKAFIRLQEEIVKVSDDHSIFAWTWVQELSDPRMRGKRRRKAMERLAHDKASLSNSLQDKEDGALPYHRNGRVWTATRFPAFRLESLIQDSLWGDPQRSTLLAPDPIVFYDSGPLPVLIPSATIAPFSMTNAGLSISLPIIRHLGDELFFAVLDRRQDRVANSQTLICVPLVRHHRHANRYTRTWFPAGPIQLVRHDTRDLARETIQVCRDIQHVPFYYPAFGGTAHQYGFWTVYPRGIHNHRLLGGVTSPNGVFNDYGIYVDRDEGLDDQIIGGLLVFGATDQARTPRLGAGVVLVVFLALRLKKSNGKGGLNPPTYYCKVTTHKESIVATETLIMRLYESFTVQHTMTECQHASARSLKRGRNTPVTASVHLLSNAPLSHCPGADIKLVEVDFG